MRGKRWIGVLLLALLLLLPLGAQAAENLVQNGDFSQWNESGLPEGWTYAAWTMDETTSTYWTEVEADGNRCVRLENFAENDARLEQTVAVRGNTIYRISARLRAEGISQAAFERAKKAVYGRNIVSLNSAENIANTMISLHFAGNELFGYLEEVAALTRGDVEARLREQMDPERSVLSVVSPIS